jgi:hypothetical protein
VGVDHVVLQVAQYDATSQVVDGATVVLGGPDHGVSVHPVRARNVSVVELDLMAELAGLRLDGRHADWVGTPYRDGADHVSVFRRSG